MLSDSQPGEPVAKSFAHLAPVYPELKFAEPGDDHSARRRAAAVGDLSAAPHGVAAKLIDDLLTAAEAKGPQPRVIDISADYRYATAGRVRSGVQACARRAGPYRAIHCAVPEHLDKLTTPHVAHPGCFATAVLLASVPLLKLRARRAALVRCRHHGQHGLGPHARRRARIIRSDTAICTPTIRCRIGTRRRSRRSRQTASGVPAEFNFVPHSGPFARGIHVTVQGPAQRPIKTPELLDALREFYRGTPVRTRRARKCRTSRTSPAATMRSSAAPRTARSIAVMCVDRQSGEGRRRRRDAVAQSRCSGSRRRPV